MNKLLKKYYKIIVILFSGIGLYLIWRLFAVGGYFYCGGGGFIDICIIPTGIKYSWISASTIALIFFIISLLLIIGIRKIKNKKIKIFMSLIILFLGLIGKQIFFVISPDFNFYLNPAVYKNKDNEIIDIDKYLELTTKYCNNLIEGDNFDFIHSRESMCSGKFETDFKTIDEYIKILEHAKNNNFRHLYQHTFRFIDENIGLENMIEQYNDDTFYAYVIYRGGIGENGRKKIGQFIEKNEILNLLEFYSYSIEENKNLMKTIGNHSTDSFWKEFHKELLEKIEQIPTINRKIF